jgi:hypothetical protein
MMANGGATPGPFLAIDDDEPTVIELHLKISEVMKDPPSPELITAQRQILSRVWREKLPHQIS